jgi:hypothetical protein
MKSDVHFQQTCEKAHQREHEFAEFLTSTYGLTVEVLSKGFRATREDIADYAHDVDLKVNGYLCQFKYRDVALATLVAKKWRPIVDEQLKAHRTPVDFYILRFSDATLVAKYEPFAWRNNTSWKVEAKHDESDRSLKAYYTIDPSDCIEFETWIADIQKARR